MKIIIENTRIVLSNLDIDKEEFRKFKNRFGKYDEVYHNYTYHLFKDLGSGKFVIPRYYYLGSITNRYNIEEIIDKSKKNPKIKIVKIELKKGFKCRDQLQIDAFAFLEQTILYKSKNVMLNLRTGSGKTFLGIKLITFLKFKTLIILDKLDLLEQWIDKILEFTELDKKEIKTLTGTPKLLDSIDNPDKYKNIKIFLTTYKSLSTILEKDFSFLKNFQKTFDIGLKICDEVHKEIKGLFTIDAANSIPYNLYLTATPARSDSKEDKLLSYILPFKYSFGRGIDKNIFHKILLISYNSYPNQEILESIENDKRGFNVIKYCKYISDKKFTLFSKLIIDLLTQLYINGQKKTFILFRTLDLIEKIEVDIRKSFPDITIGKFIGSVKKNERKSQLNNQLVLCTDKIFQTGIDVKDIEILINTFPMSSKVLTEQILGRLRENEKNSIYVDINDNGFPKTKNQRYSRMQVFNKFAKKIYELDYDIKKRKKIIG